MKLFLLSFIFCTNILAQDFVNESGVGSESLSLPTHQSSINGLEINLGEANVKGEFRFNFDIKVPKGISNHTPNLSLSYSSMAGVSEFGQGWSLNIDKIYIDTAKGSPNYTESDIFRSNEGELIYIREVDGKSFFAPHQNNMFSRYYFDRSLETWTIHKKDGSILEFNKDDAIKENDNVFLWNISKRTDRNGNEIRYEYIGDKKYLSKVKYAFKNNINHFVIEFSYIDRLDKHESYRSGFKVVTDKVCDNIKVKSSSGKVIRSYVLSYINEGTLNSFLNSILENGVDELNPSSRKPPVSFKYNHFEADHSNKSKKISFSDTRVFPPSLNNNKTTLIDINRDSYPDILETSRKGAKVWINNKGESFNTHYKVDNFISILGTKFTKLLDMDGDRVVDFVSTGLNKNYYKGGVDVNGEIFFDSSPLKIKNLPPYPLNIGNVRTLDLNLDGRQDLIARDVNKFSTYISSESGDWTKVNDFNLNTNVFDLSSPYTFVSDINGDGLPDISYVRPNAFITMLNKGNGAFSVPEEYKFSNNDPLILRQFFYSKNNFVIDVNSDGLSDLVSAQANFIYVSLNQGNRSFGETITFTNIHEDKYDLRGLNISTGDMNGDGNIDILFTNDYHDYRYFSFAESKVNLLSEINNGIGKKTFIDYSIASLLSDRNLNVPFPIKTVTSIEEVGKKLLFKKEFFYENSYYDPITNEFRGFELVETLDLGDDHSKDLLTRMSYELAKNNINEAQKQMPLYTDKLYNDNGTYKSLERYDYLLDSLVQFDSLSQRTPSFIYNQRVTKTESDEFESSSRNSKVEKEIILNDGVIQTIKDFIFKENDVLERVEETILANGPILDRFCYKNIYDSNNNLIYSEKNDYDNLNTCNIDKGNLTQISKFNGTSYELKKSYAYTSFGGVETITDSLSNFKNISYGTFDLNITSISDSASLSVSATYDPDTSVMLSFTDENSLSTSIYYDEYLRQSKKVSPGDSLAYPTEEYSYTFGNDNSYSSIATKKRIDSGILDTFDSVTYFDSIGRDLCSIEEGEQNILTCKTYSTRGEVAKQYQPQFVSNFSYPENISAGFFENFYDSLNRLVFSYNPEHLLPVSSFKQMNYKVGFIESFDELAKKSSEHFDVLGRVSKRVDSYNNEVLYEYTPLDLLTKITNTNFSETILKYDFQKRRICKNDPNIGLKLYSYNTHDLLTQTSDYGFHTGHNECNPAARINPRLTSYEYLDGRNRLTKIDYPVNSNTSDILMSYDSSNYSKGKLSLVDFGVGSRKLDYDIYGNESKRTLNIDSNSYVTLKTFNSLGLLKRIDYPIISSNSFYIDYEFNKHNLIESIKDSSGSYAYFANYTPLKQVGEINFKNNVKATYSFNDQDQSYRLTRILTEKIGTPNITLQDLNYSYDSVSNITQRQDQLNSFSENYSYDDLHRLTEANLNGQIKSFSFDSIGNIQTKDSKSYSYQSSRKQILASVDSDAYSFDPYGNIQSDPYRNYIFDFRDRLTSVTKNMQTSNYFYDNEDLRVKKVTTSGTSYYIDKYTEVTPSGIIRHIYSNDKLIASMDELGQVTYNHQDHLMSSNLRTDDQGSVIKRVEYMPFGSTRSQTGSYDRIKLRYTSQYEDEESGLYYYKRRFYNSELGRFVSADPLYAEEIDERGVDTQEMNLYAYVRNNPIKYVDPSGEIIVSSLLAVGAVNAAVMGVTWAATKLSMIAGGTNTPQNSESLNKGMMLGVGAGFAPAGFAGASQVAMSAGAMGYHSIDTVSKLAFVASPKAFKFGVDFISGYGDPSAPIGMGEISGWAVDNFDNIISTINQGYENFSSSALTTGGHQDDGFRFYEQSSGNSDSYSFGNWQF